MKQIIRHFTDDDLYKFTTVLCRHRTSHGAQVKYTFTDRDNTAYPVGFAQALEEQIMTGICNHYRRGDRFHETQVQVYPTVLPTKHEWVKVHQDQDWYVDIEGCWSNTICWK